MVAVCSSSTTLLMSPLLFSIMEEISLEALSVTFLISSLTSSHMLYILSVACHVCLVALSIISAACLDRSRSRLIHFIMDRAISSAFWVADSCCSRVAMAHIPLGSMLGGAQ